MECTVGHPEQHAWNGAFEHCHCHLTIKEARLSEEAVVSSHIEYLLVLEGREGKRQGEMGHVGRIRKNPGLSTGAYNWRTCSKLEFRAGS